jgi:hypothetical protein
MPSTSYKKQLEGVKRTEELDALLKECLTNTSGNDASAARMLQEFDQQPQEWLPIPIVESMKTLLNDAKHEALEQALSKTQLVFTPRPSPPSQETQEERRYRLRLDRLKLREEETRYSKLTNNLDAERPDDVTTKSMTYAASVGLNMIIAPISFGVFMYFFAGGILDYFFPSVVEKRTANGTDVKRVIVGVISGVLMLFIEMILFVIRTHEFEKHTLRKDKKNPKKPFGHYSSKDIGVYQDGVLVKPTTEPEAILKKQE